MIVGVFQWFLMVFGCFLVVSVVVVVVEPTAVLLPLSVFPTAVFCVLMVFETLLSALKLLRTC